MYKILRLVKRRSGVSLEAFKEYWLRAHQGLASQAGRSGQMRKVVASVSTGEVALGGKEAEFDGMSAFHFSRLADARAALAGALPSMAGVDEPSFVDATTAPVRILAEEHLVSEKPQAARLLKTAGQLKIIRTVYRRRDLTPRQFKDYWLSNHAKLEERVIAESPMQRIVATFTIPADGHFGMDGMAELYFASVDDIRATFASSIPAMMRKDEENFVQMDAPAIRAVAEEYVMDAETPSHG